MRWAPLRALTVVIYVFDFARIFVIDVWQSGISAALWNLKENAKDLAHWIFTGDLGALRS